MPRRFVHTEFVEVVEGYEQLYDFQFFVGDEILDDAVVIEHYVYVIIFVHLHGSVKFVIFNVFEEYIFHTYSYYRPLFYIQIV